MNKEVLEKLLAVMKETSPQDLWEQVKILEEKLEEMEGSIEDMEQLVVDMIAEEAAEGEKSLEDANIVAKEKGLPLADGNLVRKYLGLSFNAGINQPQTKGVRGKKSPKDYAPTDEELIKINELSNIDLSKEQVYVFTLRSAGQDVDRSFDQFTAKALKDMAEMSKDKPFLRDHNWDTGSVIGKIFDASVKDKQLVQKVYVPITEKNADMIEGIMSGIYNKVSVGFGMEPMEYICSSCNKSLYSRDCAHYPGNKDAAGTMVIGQIKGVSDYFEISNVAVPAQPAAGIRRSLSVQTPSTVDGNQPTREDLNFESTDAASLDSAVPTPAVKSPDLWDIKVNNEGNISFFSNTPVLTDEMMQKIQAAYKAQTTKPNVTVDEARKIMGLDPLGSPLGELKLAGPESPAEVIVDKILNDNSDGENPVEHEQELPVVEEKEVELPEAPATAPEELPQAETKAEESPDALQAILAELKALKGEIESLKASKEVEKESEVAETTEEIVRNLAATTVTPASPSAVDFTKPGWSKAIAAALTQKPNQ